MARPEGPRARARYPRHQVRLRNRRDRFGRARQTAPAPGGNSRPHRLNCVRPAHPSPAAERLISSRIPILDDSVPSMKGVLPRLALSVFVLLLTLLALEIGLR